MFHNLLPLAGSLLGLVGPQASYQQQFQTYYNYFLNQYQLQQYYPTGFHWVLYGDSWYLVPVHQIQNLFFYQNNRDFQEWQLKESLETHAYNAKNSFQRILDVLDKRLTNQDGEIKDIKEKLDEISSKISEKPKVSFPWAMVISASSFSSPTSSESLSEVDRQWQFLYELSKKLFESSKKSADSDLNKNPKDSVVQWFKDKFSGSIENTDDKWENFKSLCEAQKAKETKSGKDVDNEYSRLCFVDQGEKDSVKGDLFQWHTNSNVSISSYENLDFQYLTKTNWDLWDEFNKKYPSSNPADKFSEWYDGTKVWEKTALEDLQGKTGIEVFKSIMSLIEKRTS